ncbi:MAG: glycosyltransferase family 2 protein [Treponema sp.]
MSYFFSIIIPVYNAEQYLPRALDSIVTQDFDIDKIEVIIVNDGSPKAEECRSIVNEYSKKLHIKFIDNEKNQGLYMARKLGVAGVNDGEGYLLHLDSDDYLNSNACRVLYEDIKKNGDADYIEFNYYGFYKKKKHKALRIKKMYDRNIEKILSFKQNHTIWNKCYKISFIKAIYANMPVFYSYYNEDYYQIAIIDYYVKNRRFIKIPLYIYVIENGITSTRKYDKEKLKKVLISIHNVEKYLCDFYKDKDCEAYIPIIKDYDQFLYTSCIKLADICDFFDIYLEIEGTERLKTVIIDHIDELNKMIKAYAKKMKLLLPIKIVIAPFRAFYRFCKKCNEKEV